MTRPVSTRRRRRTGASKSFDPSALFTNGQLGFWYDISDMSTLYQDSAGTTPVTAVGQNVGLVIDKSQGGKPTGPELVTNGDFSDGATGWSTTGTWSIGSGYAEVTGDGTFQNLSTSVTTTIGKWYEIKYDVLANTLNGELALSSASFSGTKTAPASVGSNTMIVASVAALPLVFVCRSNATSGTLQIDNISVREIPGWHAVQSTTAAQPIYQVDAGGRPYLDFDGLDDQLQIPSTTFSGTEDFTYFIGLRKIYTAGSQWFLNLGLSGLDPSYPGMSISAQDYGPLKLETASGGTAQSRLGTNYFGGKRYLSFSRSYEFVNGVGGGWSGGPVTQSFAGDQTRTRIGCRDVGFALQGFAQIDLYQAVFVFEEAGTDIRQKVEAYINDKVFG